LLPPFTPDGLLPAGDYELTIDELRTSELVLGFDSNAETSTWDTPWRAFLFERLAMLVMQLRAVDIHEIYINGSFVEDKPHPNDIDGYFVCDLHRLASGELTRELNLLDPHKIWTWDPALRRPYRGYPKKQLPMWHQYRVELYPHYGQTSGIRDRYGNLLTFPSAFRCCRRSGAAKGIIQLKP